MAIDKEQFIRETAINQLEALLKIGGQDIAGTSLELQLNLAVSTLKNGESTLSVSVPVEASEKEPVFPVVEEQTSFDPEYFYDEYDEGFYEDEDNYYEYDDNYNDIYEPEAPTIPEGFDDEASYQDFLRGQELPTHTFEDEETGEEVEETIRPDDVVGIVNGREVGNLEESLNKVDEYVVGQNTIRDEETGDVLYQNEPEEVPYVSVSIERADGNELTPVQLLSKVMKAPESSTMLKVFGDNFKIIEGDTPAEKIVQFFVDNNNETSRKAAQGLVYGNGMMQFGGQIVVPGIGLVKATTIFE